MVRSGCNLELNHYGKRCRNIFYQSVRQGGGLSWAGSVLHFMTGHRVLWRNRRIFFADGRIMSDGVAGFPSDYSVSASFLSDKFVFLSCLSYLCAV